MFLFWIGFYYLVLVQVWVCEVEEFLFVLLVYCVVVFEVEAFCLSPPYWFVLYVGLYLGLGRNSGQIVIFGSK